LSDRSSSTIVTTNLAFVPFPSRLTAVTRGHPPGFAGGRPRATGMRAAADALFYLPRTGCPWRYLPQDGRFPPRSTVYNIFRGFQRDGAWEAIAATLVEAERQRQGSGRPERRHPRQPDRPGGGKGGPRADPVGYDAGKRTKGRKRHLLSDTLGLPLRPVLHSAGIQDRDGAALVMEGLARAVRTSNSSGLTPATSPVRWMPQSPPCLACVSRSSSARSRPDGSSCPDHG
jgi:transposase